MSQPIEQTAGIQSEIEDARLRMERRLHQLEHRVREPVARMRRAVDVPGMVRRRPWVAVVAAVAAGYVGTRLVRGRRDVDRPRRAAVAPLAATSRSSASFGALKTAAAAIAIDVAKGYFNQRMPALVELATAAVASHRRAAVPDDDSEPYGV